MNHYVPKLGDIPIRLLIDQTAGPLVLRNKLTEEGKRVKNNCKLLAEEFRLGLLHLLIDGEQSVTAMSNHFGMSQPSVSYHLELLKSAGLFSDRKDGKFINYSICESGRRILGNAADFFRTFDCKVNTHEIGTPHQSKKREKAVDLESMLLAVVKAFKEEMRFLIFDLLKEKEMNVGEMSDALSKSQPSISHHLALLREANLLVMRKDGKHNFYSIPEKARNTLSLISEYLDSIATKAIGAPAPE
ncbi:transcriptional regulator [Candidatus Peribacteria bacterium]|nr:transcriptional regulator [Candidatus Peribacteria bacterium]